MIRTTMLNRAAAPIASSETPRPPLGRQLYPAGAATRICRQPQPAAAVPDPRLGLRSAAVWLCLWSLGLALPASGAAQAPSPQAQTSPATIASKARTSQRTAQVHFEAALEHYRARRFREAIREFELSVVEMPSAEIWFDIARAHEQLGEYRLAIDNYRRYLRDRVDAPDADDIAHRIETLSVRADAARLARPRAQPPSALAIDATQPGALVLLDGRQLGIAPLDQIVDVTPGVHRLDVTRAGYVPFRAEVAVEAGALSAAYVDMRPLTRPMSAPASRFWTWCAATASATALLTSGGLGFQALERRDDGDLRSARRWARASDVALGGALTFAVAATILYFAEGHAERAPLVRPPTQRGAVGE